MDYWCVFEVFLIITFFLKIFETGETFFSVFVEKSICHQVCYFQVIFAIKLRMIKGCKGRVFFSSGLSYLINTSESSLICISVINT